MSDTHNSQVRRDFGTIGLQSSPRVGIHIRKAIKAIENFLQLNRLNPAFLVGVGNIGKAVLKHDYQNFGVEILAGFDTDLSLTSTQIAGVKIFPLENFSLLAKRMSVHIGIICTPANHAQSVADLMIEASIKGIWNFSPAKLIVPASVTVENVDLYSGLAVLCKSVTQTAKTLDT